MYNMGVMMLTRMVPQWEGPHKGEEFLNGRGHTKGRRFIMLIRVMSPQAALWTSPT